MEPLATGVMAVAKAAFPAVLQKMRADHFAKAQAIFRKQIARGQIAPMLDDKTAYGVWLYFRAAADGAAARNLELIGQAVVNDIKDSTLISEDLKRVTDTLSTLSREEAIILGTMVRAQKLISDQHLTPDQFWSYVQERMTDDGSVFAEKYEFFGHAYALIRTGWVVPVSAFGGLVLRPTARLEMVGRMVDFEDPDVTSP